MEDRFSMDWGWWFSFACSLAIHFQLCGPVPNRLGTLYQSVVWGILMLQLQSHSCILKHTPLRITKPHRIQKHILLKYAFIWLLFIPANLLFLCSTVSETCTALLPFYLSRSVFLNLSSFTSQKPPRLRKPALDYSPASEIHHHLIFF